ncbi:DUF1003 domain-containing protein [Dysgonomonas sp. HDW5B]|uniref:DUF1003 domain-containing protein n=1 Tax=Dysgonomonas sp. HDW5B TaxID=2714927 RepID=UPI001409C2FB|nr:DUF1003 domain-containing protein [Dysgonomonas sp. HDW5B]QIK53271.1 DUF1003 domain-containing protein [Dysgonomonas sp. HDW5B]
MKEFISDISNQKFPLSQRISGSSIRNSILELIQREHPDFDRTKFLAIPEMNLFREKYISSYLTNQLGTLSDLETKVLSSVKEHSTLADKLDDEKKQNLTTGQKVADKVATFGGSWVFIISFGVFIFIWIALNIFWFANKGFDPYPFILLNLLLSCLAAIQAPIIMMSQNRQEEKDRDRSKKDYMINLKSELEVRTLHEKIDHLMIYQQQDLIEIQKIQIEMMNDILAQVEKNNKNNQF